MQPAYQGIDKVYKSKADNKDIRDLIESLVPTAKAQMREFSKQFKGGTEKQTCKKIFDYIKTNFKYVADGGQQIVKLPSALLEKKVGDCKSYALFTAAILENLKIPYKFVYTSYSANPIPQHIYVVTKDNCIIDVVYGKFNQEKKPTYKYIKDMDVRYMAGIGCSGDCGCGMGAVTLPKINLSKAKTAVTAAAKNAGSNLKTGGLAGGRALFLAMVQKNLDGMATKLTKVDANLLKSNWSKVGGDYTALQNAIKKGSGLPAKKLGFLGKLRQLLAKKGVIKGIGAASDAEIQAAIVTISTTIGTAIAPAAGTAAGASVGAVLAGIYPVIMQLVKQTPATESGDIVATDLTNDANAFADQGGSGGGFGKLLPVIAIGGAVLYFVLNKKK
jgi:ribosomal protein L17